MERHTFFKAGKGANAGSKCLRYRPLYIQHNVPATKLLLPVHDD